MAVSAVYYAPGVTVTHRNGHSYKADPSSGLITVPYAEAVNVGGISAQLPLRYLTGTTADRLSLNPSAAAPNQLLRPSMVFWDTTLATAVYYVGSLSSTLWADYQGNQV